MDWSIPQNNTDHTAFLWLVNYHWNHIKDFAVTVEHFMNGNNQMFISMCREIKACFSPAQGSNDLNHSTDVSKSN